MFPIIRELTKGNVRLELLNTLDPEKVQEYAERSYPWINDPEINQYLGRQGSTIETTVNWYRTRPSMIETDRTFAIWIDSQHVGSCGIHSINIQDEHASLGILIGKSDLLSKGIGTNAMRAMCIHAFSDLGLRKLWLHVVSHNHRGIRCYEKCGFKKVGRKLDHYVRAGELRDEITMELFTHQLIDT